MNLFYTGEVYPDICIAWNQTHMAPVYRYLKEKILQFTPDLCGILLIYFFLIVFNKYPGLVVENRSI